MPDVGVEVEGTVDRRQPIEPGRRQALQQRAPITPVLGQVCHLGAIDRVQLGQDLADEDLDRALADVELVGDHLVGLALPKPGEDLDLARRQALERRLVEVAQAALGCLGKPDQARGRDEGAAPGHILDGRRRLRWLQAGRDVAADTLVERRRHVGDVVTVGQKDQGHIRERSRQALDALQHLGRLDPFAADAQEHEIGIFGASGLVEEVAAARQRRDLEIVPTVLQPAAKTLPRQWSRVDQDDRYRLAPEVVGGHWRSSDYRYLPEFYSLQFCEKHTRTGSWNKRDLAPATNFRGNRG